MLKKLLFSLCVLVFTSGCKEISGKLVVPQALTIINTNGEQVVIPQGTHDTKMSLSDDRIEAQIKVNRKRHNLEINTSDMGSLPENGRFSLASNRSGQPFDILGDISTTRAQSNLQRGQESCQYTTQEPVCGPMGCSIQTVIRNGFRDIEFYEEITTRMISFQTLKTGTQMSLGEYNGSSEVRERIKTYEGRCF